MSTSIDSRFGPAQPPSGTAQVVAVVVSVTVTVAAYRLWLGWHEPKHLVPGTTSEVGPHEAWQVIGLALTLGGIAAVGGWLRLVTPTAWGASLAVSFMLSVEAATEHQEDASIWPVGAAMLLGVSLLGLFAVGLAFQGLRRLIGAVAAR